MVPVHCRPGEGAQPVHSEGVRGCFVFEQEFDHLGVIQLRECQIVRVGGFDIFSFVLQQEFKSFFNFKFWYFIAAQLKAPQRVYKT